MPGGDGGDKTVRLWPAIIYALMLFGCVIFTSLNSNGPPALAPPAVLANPTNTSIPTSLPQERAIMMLNDLNVVVLDQTGKPFEPFIDVVIRVSDSPQTDSGQDGRLLVEPCPQGQWIRAWAPGYEIAAVPCDDGKKDPYQITLRPLDAYDYPYYRWSSVTECNNCHGNQLGQNVQIGASFNEVNEWLRSGHGKVFEGRHFESMYRGTTVNGVLSSTVNPVIIGNDWVPVPPEQGPNYHGPGFLLDFPQQPGNCAYCHVPAAVLNSQEGAYLGGSFPSPAGVAGEGITCDVCHKVFDVRLDDRGFPFTNRPGVLSYQFMRPQNGVFMVGPFTNTLTMKSGFADHRLTCSPIFSQSEFCAPCHFGKFGDMVIYNSYGEWRASPYAANREDTVYRTCQDCHMSHLPASDTRTVWSQRQACSANNTLFQNFDHNMMDVGRYDLPGKGVDIPRLVQNAAEIALDFNFLSGGTNSLDVTVQVTNTQAGHKFPTDSPLRHLILEVQAQDRVGTPLIHLDDERIPNWAGPGPLSPGYHVETLNRIGVQDYSGRPGKVFANLLVEEETNLSPATAYWNETKYAFETAGNGANSDNRLRPLEPDTSTYSFAVPDAGNVQITVTLLYRFAFYDLMVQKEWFDRPDIVVATVQCQGPATQPHLLRQSCVQIAP
ncbi:MAG TPA: hypothetical protein VK897_10200 [Anaerolineales bacterium]|nr:hypothetical protein [Anaerolineales bacterium]